MGKRSFQPSEELQRRNAEMQELYDRGLSLRQIGRKFGITYERVRQCIDTSDRAAMRALERAIAREAAYRARLRKCRVCDVEFYSGGGRPQCCSKECSETYNSLRYQLDPVRRRQQRVYSAHWTLEHPERHTEAQLQFARDVLDGKITLPDRTFMYKQTAERLAILGLQPAEVETRPFTPRIRVRKTHCKHGHPRNEDTQSPSSLCAYCQYVTITTRRGATPMLFEEWLVGRKERKEKYASRQQRN